MTADSDEGTVRGSGFGVRGSRKEIRDVSSHAAQKAPAPGAPSLLPQPSAFVIGNPARSHASMPPATLTTFARPLICKWLATTEER